MQFSKVEPEIAYKYPNPVQVDYVTGKSLVSLFLFLSKKKRLVAYLGAHHPLYKNRLAIFLKLLES